MSSQPSLSLAQYQSRSWSFGLARAVLVFWSRPERGPRSPIFPLSSAGPEVSRGPKRAWRAASRWASAPGGRRLWLHQRTPNEAVSHAHGVWKRTEHKAAERICERGECGGAADQRQQRSRMRAIRAALPGGGGWRVRDRFSRGAGAQLIAALPDQRILRGGMLIGQEHKSAPFAIRAINIAADRLVSVFSVI